MTISKIKAKTQEALVKITDEMKAEGKEIKLEVNIGTKKVDVKVYEYTKHGMGMRNLRVSAHANLIGNEHGFLFVKAAYTGPATYGAPYSDEFHKEAQMILAPLVTYWKEYASFKKNKALIIDTDVFPELKEGVEEVLKSQNLKLHPELIDIMDTSVLSKEFIKGYFMMDKTTETNLQKARSLYEELDVLHGQYPTFTLEQTSTAAKYPNIWDMNFRRYYYDGENFDISIMEDFTVRVEGDSIEDKIYELEPGLGEKILEEITVDRRLYNVIHTPIKHTKDALDRISKKVTEDAIRKIVEYCDDIIGSGKTEEEMKGFIAILDEKKETNIRNMDGGRAFIIETYSKEETHGLFSLYRLKGKHAFWFIMVYDFTKVFVYPNDSDEYPEQIHSFLSKQIEENMKKKFLKR